MKAPSEMTKAQRAELRATVRAWLLLNNYAPPEDVTPQQIEHLLRELYKAWPEEEHPQ